MRAPRILTRFLLICTLLAILAAPGAAVVEFVQVRYETPVSDIHGRTVDETGAAIPFVEIRVFNHPEVFSDDSLNLDQKRQKQKQVAATSSSQEGKFSLRGLPQGFYEVEFRKSGFHVLSVLIQVDPSAGSGKFCVRMGVDPGGKPSFGPCQQEGTGRKKQ
jgi:hypothetical protein